MATAELIGNAARGGDLAWVASGSSAAGSPRVKGEGEGTAELCRAVRGLTLLEAAAVPGGRWHSTPCTTRSGPPSAHGPMPVGSPSP